MCKWATPVRSSSARQTLSRYSCKLVIFYISIRPAPKRTFIQAHALSPFRSLSLSGMLFLCSVVYLIWVIVAHETEYPLLNKASSLLQ